MAPPAIINPETSLTSWSHTYHPRTEISYGELWCEFLSPKESLTVYWEEGVIILCKEDWDWRGKGGAGTFWR